jgi:hypothetical protein
MRPEARVLERLSAVGTYDDVEHKLVLELGKPSAVSVRRSAVSPPVP